MIEHFLFLFIFATFVFTQNTRPRQQNLPSIVREEDNLDDLIVEVFNLCKCVIFYQCDEDNFIIPQDELPNTRVTLNKSLRRVQRTRCSNEFYYCCKNRNETSTTVVPPIPKQYSKVCGIPKNPVLQVIDQFPWTVAIYRKRKFNNTYDFKCAGSLIHPRVVMTQRQCIHLATADDLGVVSDVEFSKQNNLLPVSKTIVHELHYSGANNNDVALIILQSPVNNARPICLPRRNQNFVGKRCTAVAWNESKPTRRGLSLRIVDLPIVDSQSCQKLLRNTSLSPDFEVHSSTLCAGGEEGKGTCRDDGGGPLMCEENGRYIQAGIVSWGVECGKKDVPGLYTNVASLIPWIEEKLMAEENLQV